MAKLEDRYVIHDAIHGQVRLTEEEMAVINHPLFGRLHRIHQTALLYYVWPGATHTRYEHSVGVLQVADTLLGAVNRRSSASRDKLYAFSEAEPGQAIRFDELGSGDPPTWAALRRIVRLTALVHDLGHGPLSHLFDAFAPWTKEVRALLRDDPRLASIAPLLEAHFSEDPSERVDHEAMSCVLFAVIGSDLGFEPWIVPSVAAVLLNRPVAEITETLTAWGRERLAPFIPFVRDLVSSSPVDADRMDYLHRDSRASGVAYGTYDKERLLKSVLCVRDVGPQPAFRLGWRESGLRAVEHFVFARFQMFAQHYYHKTNHAIMVMLREMASAGKGGALSVIDTQSLDALVGGYVGLSDESFLRLLAGDVRPGFPDDMRIRSLATQLLERRLWKRLYEFCREETPHAASFVEAMRKKHPDRRFIIDGMPLKATKDLDRGAYLLTLDERFRYHRRPGGRTWLEASPVLRVLRNEEESLVRLFVATGDASGPVDVHDLKTSATRLAYSFPPFKKDA